MKPLMIFSAMAACLALPAHAQSCAPREKVVEQLGNKFGETRQSMGLGSNNSVVEVFASHETGSWTIIVTSVNGVSCLVASGQAFEPIAEMLPAKGNDA